jgi:glutathione synthase/RimK-type ligase-like ATP-grasp enzyme
VAGSSRVSSPDLDVVLASATVLTHPDDDDQPLHRALAAVGVVARTLPWDDPAVDWNRTRACVLRATWNYIHHYPRFLEWVDRCGAATALWNPAPVVRWNSHKGYLAELAARGLPVVPTKVIARGSRVVLETLCEDWPEVVIKPAVGAGSFGTIKVARADFAAGQAHLEAMLPARDMLVQPYFRSVHAHGERAVVWIDGAFTHEVRKGARFSGDPEEISAGFPVGAPERAAAEEILAAVPGPLLYARVDLARDEAGRPHLMELELIEPSLFFYRHAPAADVMARAIARRL